MAKKENGDVIRGYRITKVIGPGMMAIAYAAQAPTGSKVFLKQYKSPVADRCLVRCLCRLSKRALGACGMGRLHFAVHHGCIRGDVGRAVLFPGV